jgi:MSHA pilin protein MshC
LGVTLGRARLRVKRLPVIAIDLGAGLLTYQSIPRWSDHVALPLPHCYVGHPPAMQSVRSKCTGFTLVELVVIIMMVGILAVVALPRFTGKHGFEERGFRDQVAAGLRHAQKAAIGARRQVRADFSADSVQFFIRACANGVSCNPEFLALSLPGKNDSSITAAAAGSGDFLSYPASVLFEPSGRPAGGRADIVVSDLPGLPIIVEAETGYVH